MLETPNLGEITNYDTFQKLNQSHIFHMKKGQTFWSDPSSPLFVL